MEKIVIVGGGSFIGNLINYIETMGCYQIVGYTDIQDHGEFFGYKHLGNDDVLQNLYDKGVKFAALGIGNRLSDTHLKQKIFSKVLSLGFRLPLIKGQNVIIHKGAQFGDGVILRDGAIIQSNVKLGDCVMIGDRAVISHDTEIGDFSQVVSGCTLGRGIKIGKSVFFGFNVVVTNDLTIVDGCTIGACSLVNKDCLESGLYFGTPCKLIKGNE
jgi:sugar O-acyltransferase (sialic acid O-acetyltransferase NeuD family)